MSRSENKERSINKIVQALYGLIQEKDYEQISMRDIQNRTSLSIGAIYHHFPQGKSDIFNEMIRRNRDKILNLDLFSNIQESDLEGSIKTTTQNFIKFHRENLQFHIALEQQLSVDKKLLFEFKGLVEDGLDKLVEKLETFQIFKNIPEKELREKAFLIFNIVESIILRHVLIIPLFESDEELATYIKNLILFNISN